MTAATLNTIRHNADGTITEGTITVDALSAPKRTRPKPTTISASDFFNRFTADELHQPQAAVAIGKDAHDMGAARISPFSRSNMLVTGMRVGGADLSGRSKVSGVWCDHPGQRHREHEVRAGRSIG